MIVQIKGIAKTTDAHIHAPGSPKQTAANARGDAEEVTGAPLTICGRNAQIRILATSSAIPAASTYPERQMPCTALLVTSRKPRI